MTGRDGRRRGLAGPAQNSTVRSDAFSLPPSLSRLALTVVYCF
jgi:hypothetical protein